MENNINYRVCASYIQRSVSLRSVQHPSNRGKTQVCMLTTRETCGNELFSLSAHILFFFFTVCKRYKIAIGQNAQEYYLQTLGRMLTYMLTKFIGSNPRRGFLAMSSRQIWSSVTDGVNLLQSMSNWLAFFPRIA